MLRRPDDAIWSNRVDQAVVAADGPAAAGALRKELDEISRRTTQLIELASRAGSSTDRQLALLRERQEKMQLLFVLLTLGVVGSALFGAWRLHCADERVRHVEWARAVEAFKADQQAQFFAGLSNELRAPLVAITGFATGLADRVSADGAARDAARRIVRDAQELLAILGNIMEAARDAKP